MTSLDFRQSKADSSLFIYHRNGEMTYLPPLLCRRHDPVRFVDSTVDLDNTSSPVHHFIGQCHHHQCHRRMFLASPPPRRDTLRGLLSDNRDVRQHLLRVHGLKSSATPTKTSTSSLTFISFGRRSSLVSRPTCSPKAYRRHCPMISGTV